jgi:hypothetical protein
LGIYSANAVSVRHDDAAAREIAEAAFGVKIFEPFTGLVLIDDEGRADGACIFNNYDGRDVHFTCVNNHRMRMTDARVVATYVFDKLGCHRCTAITRRHNWPARKALRQLGFKIEGFLREHFPDDDAVIYGVLKSEQKIARI